jgi:NADPH2:quinone reductase
MRAWQVSEHGEPEDALKLDEVEAPAPPAGMLRVRVAAAGLGLPDVLMCRGTYPMTPPLPFTSGQECVGTVTAAGEGTRTAIGTRVLGVTGFYLGHGSFADEGLLIDDFALPVPDRMTDPEAAGFAIPYHTAWVGLVQRGRLEKGETLLVLGAAGGAGSAAVMLGAALGARVLATAGGRDKVEFCERLGADVVIDYRRNDIAEQVRALTDGRGADAIFDPVGGPAFTAATKCIAHEGRILTVGFASGSWGAPDIADVTFRNYSLVGVLPGGYDRAFRERAHAEMSRLYGDGRLRVPLARVAAFVELPAALADLAAGRVAGKLALSVEG